MDGRIQKHRMIRWVGRLFIALSLLASSGVQAAFESTAAEWQWCVAPCGQNSQYPTAMAAAQAFFDYICMENPGTCGKLIPIGCDGDGFGSWFALCTYSAPTYISQLSVSGGANCPNPTVNPTVSYKYNYATRRCERSVPDTLTITLYGGTEVEPSNDSDKKFLPIIATVIDQSTNKPPTNPVKIHVSLKVDPTSGGHDHGDSTRPRGGIADVGTCASDSECWTSKESTDSNGQVVFNFNAPEVSGTHTITAICDGCSSSSPPKPVDVKVNGLETIPSSSFYTFIGKTDKHSDNHYLTPAAASILWRIAVSYQMEQRFKLPDPATKKLTVTPPVLHVNDASLKWGGRFDVYGNWATPHAEHMRGTVVDLRANGEVGAISPNNFRKAEMLFSDQNASSFLECTKDKKPTQSDPSPPQHKRLRSNLCVSQLDGSQDTNRHYHVRLMGVRE